MFETYNKMTKKQSKIKKVIKAVKPAKVTLSFKKEKPKKVVKNIKSKSARPIGAKTAKPAPKIVKKKLIATKAVKPVKKAVKVVVSKTGGSKGGKIVKTAKPVKKIIVKKPVLKPVHLAEKKVKSQKEVKAKKEIVITKPVKKSKQPEEVINAIFTKPVKGVKAIKVEKPGKKAKAQKDDEFELIEKLIKPAKKSKGGRKPKNKNDDDDEPIVENDILIEQLINSTKRLKKPSKVPKQLRTFTNPMASLTVAKLVDTNKKGAALSKKEPKGKFELEFVMHTSAGILYEFLTSPSGLAEWFADDVNIHDGVFTFFWEGSEQKAKLLGFKEDKFVRLQWLDKPDGTYFEFRIERDDLTGDISLIITDFADEAADLKTSKLLWDSQVNQLLHVIGSY